MHNSHIHLFLIHFKIYAESNNIDNLKNLLDHRNNIYVVFETGVGPWEILYFNVYQQYLVLFSLNFVCDESAVFVLLKIKIFVFCIYYCHVY